MRKGVSLRDLRIGDIVEEDIKDTDDIVLVARGSILTDGILNRLRRWTIDQDSLVTIDDGTEKYNPNDSEELKYKSLRYLKDIIALDDEETRGKIERLSDIIGIMARNLEDITAIPSDILKTEDSYLGEHYYRVARLAMAIASIHNKEVSEDEKIPLKSVGIAAYLHDYGKKYNRSHDKNSRLKIMAEECLQIDELSENNAKKTHNAYGYIALRDMVDIETRKAILFGGFDDATLSKSNDKSSIKIARIIKLCDIYDGLLNLISKKKISSPAECVIEYMYEVSEMGDISKEIYDLFVSHLPIYIRGSKVLLSNNQYAVVVDSGDEETKPTVLTLTGGKTALIDLNERKDITIKRIDTQEPREKPNSDTLKEQLRNSYRTLTEKERLSEMLAEENDTSSREVKEIKPLSKRIGAFFGAKG